MQATRKAGLSYAAPNGVTASVFCSYQGDVPDKYSSGPTPDTKAFTMLNAYLSYDLADLIHVQAVKHALLFAEIENGLDQEIWLPAQGVTPIGYTLPYHQGFLFRAGLKAEF